MQPSTLPFSCGGFTPQAPSSTPALASPQAGAAPPFMLHAAPLHSLPQGVPMDINTSGQWSSTPLLCLCCGKAGHFACYCPQGLEVCYLSALEQEELLIPLLAAQDATETPSLDALIAVHSDEVANVLEEVPTESEGQWMTKLNISVAIVDTMPETISPSSDIQTPSPAKVLAGNTPPSPHLWIPAWERYLSHCYVVASTSFTNSLKLQVEIEMMDTQQIQSVVALLDSGATGLFLDTDYVQQHCLTTHSLSCPIPVYNIDGTLNEAGSICSMVDLVLCYQDHSEQATFAITSLEKQDMILGFTWLCEHNSEIDWTKEEASEEQRAKVCEHAAVHAYHAGHLLYADINLLSPPSGILS
ncbi:hypothetical protein E4T56_gene16844 [Termitomyces sp. T112]|nr:hypothetical protein E4T56_gene16844 [Termitomyces sp. T112]